MISKNYTIVTNVLALNKMLNHINNNDYFAFDTETTGLNTRKDKVIGLSISGKEGEAYYLPRLTWDKNLQQLVQVNTDTDFLHVLNLLKAKQLLMWNSSFDIRVVKNNFKIDLTDSLLADVMLMKHTVDEEGEFKLKEVAKAIQSHIGLDVQKEADEEKIELTANVEANGGSTTKSNFEMYKADLSVMGKYACADADLTIRIAHYYQRILESESLESFFYDEEVMPLYKEVTIPMEEHGVLLDIELMEQTNREILNDMDKIENSVISQLLSIPDVRNYLDEKSLELFPKSTSGKFAQEVCKHFNAPLPKTKTGAYSLTAKEVQKLPDGDLKKFLLEGTLDEKLSISISKKLFNESDKSKINISSKQQMATISFNVLKYTPISKTDSGQPSFDEKTITHLSNMGVSWAKDLSIYNKLVKIKGTYIDRFLEDQEDGYYYFSYKQHGTVSGRFSGDAQQMPRPKEDGELEEIVLNYNNKVRQFFISEKGRSFIDSDYESLEPHVFSHCSGDEGLRDIFRKGYDFYSTIAIATEKLTGVSADKKATNYLGKVDKPKRQKAKGYCLGIPYGMQGYALGLTLGIPQDEAEELIVGYLSAYPNLKKWMERSRRHAQTFGYIKSETGRIRHLKRVKELHDIHGDRLLDFKYRKSLEKRHGKDVVLNWYMDYKNGLNNSCNFQIQSLSASIVNRSSIAIAREFKARNINAWICANIHDQIIINAPNDRIEECKEIVQRLMQTTVKLSVDLKAPPAIAHNWKEGH